MDMKKLSLSGSDWKLFKVGDDTYINGTLPGYNYLDYIKNGMSDPFYGENETEATKLSRNAFLYEKSFCLEEDFLKFKHVELIADGIDTVCEITLNGQKVANTDNINRTYVFDVLPFCKAGENVISLLFEDPRGYVEEKQRVLPLPKSSTPFTGIGHLRKTPCHFGWDWGPILPPVGITRSIDVFAYDVKIDEVIIKQSHFDGKVGLSFSAKTFGETLSDDEVLLTVTSPSGVSTELVGKISSGKANFELLIENPELWWCNGLGNQPLYTVKTELLRNGEVIDENVKKIGLRTISLDTSKDEYGEKFTFILNGVPVFAKGADWIPTDSFVQRTDRDTIFYYVNAAKEANMNMLRVWGGGTFESEDFYDACDECGILVWQDFLFACNVYPFSDPYFSKNVEKEVEDNVKRLRHRASLALWCGNNEAEASLLFMKKDDPFKKSNLKFYHVTLPKWVKALDKSTPYHPGSPSSGYIDHKLQRMQKGKIEGDSHLWHVWHGMQKTDNFGKFPTRFCSEYGLESMPSMQTIKAFHPSDSPEIFDSVMTLHQKSGSGNEKMLYYMLENYREPKSFGHFVYLSQLTQARAIANATDDWRKNGEVTSGALFWQLNDCWPVASWSGIDYYKRKKAVMYEVKAANAPISVFSDRKRKPSLYLVNDLPKDVNVKVTWKIADFSGKTQNEGEIECAAKKTSVKKLLKLPYVKNKKTSYLKLSLKTDDEPEITRTFLFVKDKDAILQKPVLSAKIVTKDDSDYLAVKSDVFARSVMLESPFAEFSDNFFDLVPTVEKLVAFSKTSDVPLSDVLSSLKTTTLSDVVAKGTKKEDASTRRKICFKKGNLLSRLAFKLFL